MLIMRDVCIMCDYALSLNGARHFSLNYYYYYYYYRPTFKQKPSSFSIFLSNVKYVTYGRSVVESKIARRMWRRKRRGDGDEKKEAIRANDGDIISVK